MTKTEYTTVIEANLATAETLCADLRQLRNLQKLAKTIPASDTLVAFDALDKAITDKEATLKATRAELLPHGARQGRLDAGGSCHHHVRGRHHRMGLLRRRALDKGGKVM